jgi:hypothetical protein
MNDKRLKTSFVPGVNYGDLLTPYFLYKENIPFIYCREFIGNKVVGAGSIIAGSAKNQTQVWGSGMIRKNTVIDINNNFLAVRGPRTLSKLKELGADTSNTVLGDPGLLLKKYYIPNINKKYKLGVIAHMQDHDILKKYLNDNKSRYTNTLLIKSNRRDIAEIEQYIDEVNSCDKIISTSLHGIITCHAYGIPVEWLQVTKKLLGDGTKFLDHFEALGISNVSPLTTLPSEDISIDPLEINLDLEGLYNRRPWNTLLDESFYVDLEQENWIEDCYGPNPTQLKLDFNQRFLK